MKWRTAIFAVMMFADCIVVRAAAGNFVQFVDDDAAVVWAAAALANVS